MKKYILFLASWVIMISNPLKGQISDIKPGIRAGFDLQNINGKDRTGDKLTLNLVPRFNLGVVAGIPIAPDFFFQPGLYFTTKGAKSKDEFLGLDMSVEYKLSYIEIPLNLLYKPILGNGNIFIGFGPYIAYGIGGKANFTIEDTSTEEKIVFGKDYESLNPLDWKYFRALDFGGNLFFGYQLENGFSVQLNSQLGLAKINAENIRLSDDETEFRNTGFGLSFGYNF